MQRFTTPKGSSLTLWGWLCSSVGSLTRLTMRYGRRTPYGVRSPTTTLAFLSRVHQHTETRAIDCHIASGVAKRQGSRRRKLVRLCFRPSKSAFYSILTQTCVADKSAHTSAIGPPDRTSLKAKSPCVCTAQGKS